MQDYGLDTMIHLIVQLQSDGCPLTLYEGEAGINHRAQNMLLGEIALRFSASGRVHVVRTASFSCLTE